MDPEKNRHSLVLPGDESVSGFSALRASTRAPSFRRLSLRKSRSSSCSTADSVSIHSTESHISPQSSCVTRDIPRDECASHRFMVWVAVKRNECERMTPSERLECPLLRCRKRFGDHELMLQHLYACDELDSGEYWCYDCGHAERFTDAKCKRCLGHPTKRRKILSMAKNFFTSLGHKSRNDGLLGQLPEDAVLVPPPSYDSLDLGLTNELCSAGEIHEIDSTEVPSNPPSAPVLAPPPPMQNPPPQREPDSALFASSTLQRPPPPCIFPAGLDTRITLAESYENGVENWINDPTAYNPSEGSGRRNSMEERRLKTRSKTLAPSSSLRSNASNSSTNTTNSSTSTNSTESTNTASTGISPSIFSDSWTVASGMDTDESPISGFICDSKFDDRDANMGFYDNAYDGDEFMRDFGISELPADPLFAPLSATSDHLAGHHDLLPRGNPSENGPGLGMAMIDNIDDLLPDFTNIATNILAEASSSPSSQSPFPSSVEPSSLVMSIWETLEAHVSSSEAKLRPMRNNGLAAQFSALGFRNISSHGHAALKAMLQGCPPESPLDILCYVHVAYAYFLVVHQEEAGIFSGELFAQALAYATGPAVPSQTEYLDIARAIWEPDDVDETTSINAETLQLESGTNPFASTFSAMGKGKGLSSGGPAMDDALLSVSRYLLDEFEYSIISNTPHSSENPSSELWTAHVLGNSLVTAGNALPAFSNIVGNTVNLITQQFGSYSGLTSALQLVDQRVSKGYIPTARRAELELLQAAHGCIPLTKIINDYAPFVRQQCDILYSVQETSMAWRCTHYDEAVDLMESMVSSIAPTRNARNSPDTSDLEEFLNLPTTPSFDTGDDVSPEDTTPWDSLSPTINTSTTFSSGASNTGASSSQPSPNSDRQDPSSTTGSSDPEESGLAAQKVEADACCDICGYRPKGAPQWFKGSMAKHKKLQHSTAPPQIYKCPYPGCTSQYKNRPDNLRQHQFDKEHFVEGDEASRRPSKRKKTT